MKILFTANFRSNFDSSLFSSLLTFLKKHYSVGVTDLNENIIKEHSNLKLVPLQTVNELDWDIFLVQGLNNLITITSKVKKKPIIVLAISSDKIDQCYLFPNLYQVWISNKNINPLSWGIPQELVTLLPIDRQRVLTGVSHSNGNKKSQYSLLYVVSQIDSNLESPRKIIKALNRIDYATIVIVTSYVNRLLLQNLVNSNVMFNCKAYNHQMIGEYDVVLASGDEATKALIEGKKVIVIGNYGFGGLVTSDNFDDFMKTDFKGRIGGVYQEIIPPILLDYEIRIALGLEEINAGQIMPLSEAQRNVLINRQINNWKTQALNQITAFTKLSQMLGKRTALLASKPKLVHNIKIKERNSEYQLYHIINDTVIATVEDNERLIINSCNGVNTIQNIVNSQQHNASEVLRFIKELWNHKIIVFEV